MVVADSVYECMYSFFFLSCISLALFFGNTRAHAGTSEIGIYFYNRESTYYNFDDFFLLLSISKKSSIEVI